MNDLIGYNTIIGENENKLIDGVIKSGIVSIVGLSKNSGKTSVLNYILYKLSENGLTAGVMTTGRDGERIDIVFETDKPEVNLPPGSVFSTFNAEASLQSPFVEVLESTDLQTSFGNVVVLKNREPISTQIIGPPSVSAQTVLIEKFKNYGVDIILIDGSLDRRSILLSGMCKGIIYVAGTSFNNDPLKIVRELVKEYKKHHIKLFNKDLDYDPHSYNAMVYLNNGQFAAFDSLIGNEKRFLKFKPEEIKRLHINTSFTEKSLERIKSFLLKFKGELVFESSFNIFLSFSNLDWLVNNINISVLNKPSIIGIGVNSFSDKGNHVDCEDLRTSVRNSFEMLPVFDVME